LCKRDIIGICFQRDFSGGVYREAGKNSIEQKSQFLFLEQTGRSPANVNRSNTEILREWIMPDPKPYFGADGFNHFAAVPERSGEVEIAVGAGLPAKRNMEINALQELIL
jgi:hypothetical protein